MYCGSRSLIIRKATQFSLGNNVKIAGKLNSVLVNYRRQKFSWWELLHTSVQPPTQSHLLVQYNLFCYVIPRVIMIDSKVSCKLVRGEF